MKSRTGSGRLSTIGGNGFAGGGGGRISLNVFSRHDNTEFFAHGEVILCQLKVFLNVVIAFLL